MLFFIITIVLRVLMLAVVKGSFTALNGSLHTVKLYQEIGNEDAPSELDAAFWHARIRRRICDDIGNSKFFWSQGLIPIEEEQRYRTLNRVKYFDTFYKIYGASEKYTNRYAQHKFKVFFADHLEEYVFTCVLRHYYLNRIEVLYVSKEYNVSQTNGVYKPGHFVFASFVPSNPESLYYLILAEEPAKPFIEPGFNVELHYLRLRKHKSKKPADNNRDDPLCKMISDQFLDTNDQHHRLCVAVYRSSYFKDRTTYPAYVSAVPCYVREVSFRTREAIAEASGQSYYERMTRCQSAHPFLHRVFHFLYISRAYESNHVFVYEEDFSNGNVYLENLSSNIDIVDESYLRCRLRVPSSLNTAYIQGAVKCENYWPKVL